MSEETAPTQLEIMKERIENVLSNIEKDIHYVVGPLADDLKTEFKEQVVPALKKVWEDLLSDVKQRIAYTQEQTDTVEAPKQPETISTDPLAAEKSSN